MAKLDIKNAGMAQAILRKAAELKAKGEAKLFEKIEHELTEAEWDWFRSKTHARQFEFLSSKKRLKVLLACRRWGKSTNGLFESLVHDKRFPGSTIMYIVPDSKSHARRLFWRPFMLLNDKLQLGLSFHETDKRITTPNGTDILLFGAHDKDAAITLRGDQSGLSLAILDECKDFGPHFEEVVVEAVLPALRDYGGTLVLQGTPGNVLTGLFYYASTGKFNSEEFNEDEWLRVIGKVEDNTFLAPAWKRDEHEIWRREYRPLGYSKSSPKFRREILAEWCTDDTERVYLYDPERNHYAFDGGDVHGLPLGNSDRRHEWMYVLGLDLGERDANAFVVFAFAQTCENVYVVANYARSHMSIDELAQKYHELEAQFGGFVCAVADTYGYGRGIVTDLQTRLGLPLIAADKKGNKLGSIAQMNSDFTSGRLKADKNGPLAKEWMRLAKKVRLTDHKVLIDHSDYGDAALYGWKASQHWASQALPVLPLPGTKEYWLEREKDDILKAVERRNSRGKAESERFNL